jgi:DNA-binding response OmpR family regulator
MARTLSLVETAPGRHPPARPPLPGRPRLLVVDDEPLIGRFMAHAADECGCEAIVAISAASFRSHYEAEPPDLVLLDLSLPGGDGIELLRYLAQRRSEAIVLIASGFDRRVVESARRLGEALGLRMGDCLNKPVRVAELDAAIGSALRRYSEEGSADDRGITCAS